MITKDCTEVFLCYKEKVQHVYIKSMKILNPQPLTVVTFDVALAYLDKVVLGKLGTWYHRFEITTLILEKYDHVYLSA